jgi:hypothetical protein
MIVGALAAADIVSIWELGSHRPDWSKALIALAPALPDAEPGELAAMTVGERNAHLLSLRRAIIGPVMHAVVKCPWLDGYAPPIPGEFAFASGDYAARYRLLNSGDLAYAAERQAEPNAREALAGRALIELSRAGEVIAAEDLPADVCDSLARDIANRDPLAHLAIPLACIACEHVWSATLQIVPFLWLELERKAKQLLEDVVVLARTYGWGESEILEMAPVRRQYYLDSIG